MKHAHQLGLIKIKRGEENYRSKISNQDANDIRKIYKKGISQKKIGNIYSVKQYTISKIVNHKIYKQLLNNPRTHGREFA